MMTRITRSLSGHLRRGLMALSALLLWSASPPTAQAAGTGCCEAHTTPGCDDTGLMSCVCATDPYCCSTAWDAVCVGEAQSLCGVSCAPGSDCCEPRTTPGCSDTSLQACVCAADPYCCATAWDQLCVGEVETACGGSCAPPGPSCGDGSCSTTEDCETCPTDCGACPPPPGSCCEPGAGVGCDEPAVQTCVCAFDPYCCSTMWDSQCVQEARTSCDPTCGCIDACVDADPGTAIQAACLPQCQAKVTALGKDPAICQPSCDAAHYRWRKVVEATCTARCVGDDDGDGIPNGPDRCPGTPAASAVTWTGCPDGDGDGIPDADDACPATPAGVRVTVDGCTPPADGGCGEGHCGEEPPPCGPPMECDQLLEVELPRELPWDLRDSMIRKALATRPHDVVCPGDETPPDDPRITSPVPSLSPILVDATHSQVQGGQLVGGDSIPLTVQWDPVVDPCGPVRYSVFVEHTHCHRVPGVEEVASYRNAGWCRWQPYLYQTIDQTVFQFDFDYGRTLFELHEPFADALGFNIPQDGQFTMFYAPYWLRVRVIAHDANGLASRLDSGSATRYFALYPSEHTPVESLTAIPVAP